MTPAVEQPADSQSIGQNTVAGSLAPLSRSNAQNRREWPRYVAEKSFALAASVDGRLLACTVADISLGGARLVFDEELPAGALIDLTDPDGQTVACERVWQDGDAVGVAFDFSEESLSLISICVRNIVELEKQASLRAS
jgi:hypothetical protein